jgi:hypothetical protein
MKMILNKAATQTANGKSGAGERKKRGQFLTAQPG